MQVPSDGVASVIIAITITTFFSLIFEVYTQQGVKKRNEAHKESDYVITGFGSWYANHIISQKRSLIFHSIEYSILSVIFVYMVVFLVPQMQIEIIGILILLTLLSIILRGAWGYVSFSSRGKGV